MDFVRPLLNKDMILVLWNKYAKYPVVEIVTTTAAVCKRLSKYIHLKIQYSTGTVYIFTKYWLNITKTVTYSSLKEQIERKEINLSATS